MRSTHIDILSLTFVWKNIQVTLAQLDFNIDFIEMVISIRNFSESVFLNTYILSCSHLHDVAINRRFETSAKLSSPKFLQ